MSSSLTRLALPSPHRYNRFTVKSTLLGHLRTHSGQRDFQCLVCKATFGTKCALRVHSRLHTGARPYQCEVCGRWFRTSGHRSIHMMTHGWPRGRRPAEEAEQTTGRQGGRPAAQAGQEETQAGQATGQAGKQTLSAQLQVRMA